MKHKLHIEILLCLLLVLSVYVSAMYHEMRPWLLTWKYCSLAILLFYLGYRFCTLCSFPTLNNRWIRYPMGLLGCLVLPCFLLLTLDTFVFHAITWFPGIIRYAVYEAYGILYVVFMLLGVCVYFGKGK